MMTNKKIFQYLHPATTTISTKSQLISTILLFRILYWFLMSISCLLIPDHNPGDDVLKFDMRLLNNNVNINTTTTTTTTDKNLNINCFCLKGHICDIDNNNSADYSTNDVNFCSTYHQEDDDGIAIISPTIWNFCLDPLTKWDAARFLNLAIQPTLRDPATTTTTSSLSSPSTTTTSSSEQAHAFLPMFPTLIAKLALLLSRGLLPKRLLPPTFEGVVVLSGFILNNVVSLIISTLALYHLTIAILRIKNYSTTTTTKPSSTTSSSPISTTQSNNDDDGKNIEKCAIAVCLVHGIWNPALVFMTTNYSESLFSTCTFVGHCFFTKTIQWMMSTTTTTSNNNNTVLPSIWSLTVALMLSVPIWMVATYTRSNGTIHSLWLLQYGLAILLYNIFSPHRRRTSSSSSSSSAAHSSTTTSTSMLFFKVVLLFGMCIVCAIFIAIPFRYHDWNGYQLHCNNSVDYHPPSWCYDSKTSTSSFSLYAWTQRTHWNVGLFHYYQMKQIPNFLLAAPILTLSIMGVISWIRYSLIVDYGKGKLPKSISACVIHWPIHALSDSVYYLSSSSSSRQQQQEQKPPPVAISTSTTTAQSSSSSSTNTGAMKYDDDDPCTTQLLVQNPILLGHYAILAFLTLVGIVLAHVQISTRMICSSSPAIIWFLTYCHLSTGTISSGQQKKKNTPNVNLFTLQGFMTLYTLLYMLLGVVLHVNFLPWT